MILITYFANRDGGNPDVLVSSHKPTCPWVKVRNRWISGNGRNSLEISPSAIKACGERVIVGNFDARYILKHPAYQPVESKNGGKSLTNMMKYAPSGCVYLMPSLSKALIIVARLSKYSLVCCSKKPLIFACSRPAATASCKGELVQKTMRVDAASVGMMMEGGPTSQPTRHPVAEKASKERSSCPSIGYFPQVPYIPLTACWHGGHCTIPHTRQRGKSNVFVVIKHETVILFGEVIGKYLKHICGILTTSSAMTRRLCSSAMTAMFSSSCFVKTLPTGLCGVLMIIILVRGVIARLQSY